MSLKKDGLKICRGCGRRTASGGDHCVFPSNRGPFTTSDNHPSNDGSWSDVVVAVKKLNLPREA